jgi:2,4-dienoyl-CoA reductase-like NADH-dependent reductase (Old Yellow Enzyme family)
MLLQPLATRSLQLANRIVMAPMTRSRAIDANTPNALMAEYYGQQGTAGLIITEGTSPSPNGLGYARIPGLFNEGHVRGASPQLCHARLCSGHPDQWVSLLRKGLSSSWRRNEACHH